MPTGADDRDLHVLHLPSFYPTRHQPYSGTFFRDWAIALKRAGVKVGIVYVEGRSLRDLSPSAVREAHFQTTSAEDDGVSVLRLHGWNTLAQWTPGGLVWARLTQRAVREYVAQHGVPDLVAAQSATWGGVAALHAKARWHIPYVITEVNTKFGTGEIRGWQAAISRRCFAGAESVIAISENLRARLNQFGGARNVALIPCTVDDSYWTLPATPRARDPFTFYAQAHLTRRKGIDLLIRAFSRRFRGDATVRLVIGGDGEARSELEALVDSADIRSQVQFLGAIPRDAVRDAMWRANCFVLPSWSENFGVVLIEALSTGLPVISTRCGGPEDIIQEAVGMLLEPGDEAGLADALSSMRAGGDRNPETVRAYARERYGYDAVGAQLRDYYRVVCGGFPRTE